MVYNHFNKGVLIITTIITSLFFYSCNSKEENRSANTYYVELINFNDSFKNYISASLKGKVSFYKNEKLQIFSTNYITEDYPDMHYFKPIEEITEPIDPGAKKIRIEFDGKYSIDSIKYLIKKYQYNNKEWKKISDMGFIKGFSTYKNMRDLALREYGNQIINNIAAYTYN